MSRAPERARKIGQRAKLMRARLGFPRAQLRVPVDKSLGFPGTRDLRRVLAHGMQLIPARVRAFMRCAVRVNKLRRARVNSLAPRGECADHAIRNARDDASL